MNRIITEEQVRDVINVLSEMQAKYNFNTIAMLQNLPQEQIPTQSEDRIVDEGKKKIPTKNK